MWLAALYKYEKADFIQNFTFILPMILMYPFSSIVAKSLQQTKTCKGLVIHGPADQNMFSIKIWIIKDLPAVEPTAGLNAGVSFLLILPVSQHDTVSSKANLPRGVDG